MTQESEDRILVAKAKTVLERSSGDLNPTVIERLRDARIRVIETPAKPLFWVLPAGWFATATIALLILTLWFFQPPRHTPVGVNVDDLEILTSAENLELLDDLEFYHWLAESEVSG